MLAVRKPSKCCGMQNWVKWRQETDTGGDGKEANRTSLRAYTNYVIPRWREVGPICTIRYTFPSSISDLWQPADHTSAGLMGIQPVCQSAGLQCLPR